MKFQVRTTYRQGSPQAKCHDCNDLFLFQFWNIYLDKSEQELDMLQLELSSMNTNLTNNAAAIVMVTGVLPKCETRESRPWKKEKQKVIPPLQSTKE